mgnify:CR=1 FL=1
MIDRLNILNNLLMYIPRLVWNITVFVLSVWLTAVWLTFIFGSVIVPVAFLLFFQEGFVLPLFLMNLMVELWPDDKYIESDETEYI